MKLLEDNEFEWISVCFFFFFSSRRRHTRCSRDWSSDVCSSDLNLTADYDFDMGTDVIGDQAPPRGGGGSSPAIWTADGKSVIVTTTEHGRSNLEIGRASCRERV